MGETAINIAVGAESVLDIETDLSKPSLPSPFC